VGHGVTCTALSAINSINLFTWTWRLGDTRSFWSRGSQNQGGACMADDRMTYQVGTVGGDDESFIKAAFAQWAMWGLLATDGISLPHIIHVLTSSLPPFPPAPHSAILSHKPFPFSSFEKHYLRPSPTPIIPWHVLVQKSSPSRDCPFLSGLPFH
jgi:hypothetical protein